MRNKKPVVYILLEMYRRDFDSRLKIKSVLESRGFNIVFGHKDTIRLGIRIGLLPPGIIFDKCAQDTKFNYWHKIKKRGFMFTLLDEEGIHTFKKEIKMRIGEPKYIDMIFFNNLYQYIVTKSIYKEKGFTLPNNKISGNPRLEELLENYNFKENLKRKIPKLFVIGNYRFMDWNPYKDQDRAYKKIVKKFIADYKYKSKYEFIYRPHPAEDFEIESLCNKAGIKVERYKTINQIIEEADILITNRCTVSIESIIKKNDIVIFSYYHQKSSNIFTRCGTSRFKSLDQINNLLNDYIKNESLLSQKIKRQRSILMNLFEGKKNSVDIITSWIIENSRNLPKYNFNILFLRSCLVSLIGVLLNNIIPARRRLRFKIDNHLVKKAIRDKKIKKNLGLIYF